MKKLSLPILLMSLAISMLWNGCVKDIADLTQSASYKTDFSTGQIPVTGRDAEAPLKSTLTNLATEWIASSDKVGVFSAQARTAYGGNTPAVNMEFTAVSSGANSNFEGNMYWGEPGTSHTFYAYYPYQSGQPTPNTIPVSLPSSQVQQSANSVTHIGALDFLIATPTSVVAPVSDETVGDAVNLHYNHLFTILEFQIKGTGTLKAVKLATNSNLAFTSGQVDIAQATPAAGTPYTLSISEIKNQITTTLSDVAILSDVNSETKIFMIINPSSLSDKCVISLSSDGSSWNYLKKSSPEGGFRRGKKYLVTVDASSAFPVKGFVSDIEGNVYNTNVIGTQTWIIENLKTTKYNDGTSIPLESVNAKWINIPTPAYCWYNNDKETYKDSYGALYDNYAIDVTKNGGKNVCPIGWHVPTNYEFEILTNYLSRNGYDYGKTSNDIAKSMASTSGWTADGITGNPGNDQNSNNLSGFNGLPSGYHSATSGMYSSLGNAFLFWTSTEISSTSAYIGRLNYNSSIISNSTFNKSHGLSVRCLKD